MPKKKYLEVDTGENSGAVENAVLGAMKQANQNRGDAKRILEARLSMKKDQVKNETTESDMHETWLWIAWLESAIKKISKK